MIEFDDKYTGNPDFNCENSEGCEGRMETYSPHVDLVTDHMDKHPQTIWTIIEGDDGNLYITAGFHRVNRFLYFISNEQWSDANEEYLWS